MDEEDCPPSHNTSLILPKDYVPAPAAISSLDPRLQVCFKKLISKIFLFLIYKKKFFF